MAKYKVMVVGMGKRGKHHAAAFQANENFEVTGICDISQDMLNSAAVYQPRYNQSDNKSF